MNLIDITGQRFGKLVVEKRIMGSRSGCHSKWLCKCDCGNYKEVASTHLRYKRISSCGCLKNIVGPSHKLWGGHGEISASYFARLKQNSKIRNRAPIDFEITIEYIWDLFLEQERKCALSGVELGFGRPEDTTASLDRIDSTKGYIVGNVQWLHKRINMMKGSLEQGYFIELCKKVANNV
jgi:hypothetical protein